MGEVVRIGENVPEHNQGGGDELVQAQDWVDYWQDKYDESQRRLAAMTLYATRMARERDEAERDLILVYRRLDPLRLKEVTDG